VKEYITKLPRAEHATPEWRAAVEALILVPESDGPTMFARIGIVRALNRHVERVFHPDRKDQHWVTGSSGGTNRVGRLAILAVLLIVALLIIWQVFGAAWG
jgi:hypothetical protein